MASFNARITMPAEAKAGEIVEIRVLVRHPMDRGGQVDSEGRVVPRKILNRLTVTYAGEPVFRYDMHTGVSANPFVSFTTRAVETGDLTFEWREDGGATFGPDGDTLRIRNRDSTGTFEIEIPYDARRVEIRVAGKQIFARDSGRVVAPGVSEGKGVYVLPLGAP